MRHGLITAVTILALMALGGTATTAQDYPSAKPIRLITGSVGGGTDFASRVIAQGISASLGQQVIVENRGGGVIHGDLVAKSPPDGYTLLLHGSNIWLAPLLRDNVPYDPLHDLAPITLTNTSPNILIVHPSLPVKTTHELVALAKARPAALNYSSGAAGSSGHLSAELFNVMAGVKIVRIAYKNGSQEIADLVGGQVQMSFGNAAQIDSHIKARKLRALAVTSAQPSALFPDIPTVSASGVPGYEALAIYAMFAPTKTPPPLIQRLNQEVVRLLQRPDIKDKFLATGVEVVGNTPEQLGATMKNEIAKWGKIIRDGNIREE